MSAREIVAAAAWGDPEALAAVAGSVELARVAVEERLAPLIAARRHQVVAGGGASGGDLAAVELVTRAARAAAIGHLVVDGMLERVAPALVGTSWCLIKGADVRDRVYPARDVRVIGDLDLLVDEEAFVEVRRRALEVGFRDFHSTGGPLYEAFLREEAHAWQANAPGAGLLEIHPRLWGLLPANAARDVLASASGDPPRPSLADAYLLAAVHVYLDPPPRRLASWLELRLIAERMSPGDIQLVQERATHWGIELVLAAAADAVVRWFPQGVALPELPRSALRRFERRALERSAPDEIPLARLALARMLSGRPSRMGWHGAWRRLWPHPGLVARATPEHWSWPRRRMSHWWRGRP